MQQAGLPRRPSVEAKEGIDLQVFTTMREVEQQWRIFEQLADCTVFQTFDWLSAWQRHIGTKQNVVPVIVLGFAGSGEMLLLLPLGIECRGRFRRLRWLGSDLCDYNAPLLAKNFSDRVEPGQFAALWRQIISEIRTNPRLRFDVVELDKMPEVVGSQPNPFLNLPILVSNFGAHVATLTSSWDQFYVAKRSASSRKSDRRKFKNLAEHGKLRFVDVQERADIEHTMATLIQQKRSSYARMGVSDMFTRDGYPEFYQAIVTDLRLRDVVHISRLDVGSEPAATGLGLKFKSCYYLVLSSYQDGAMAKNSPGRAHIHEILRYAIERKMQTFDFTIGDEPYKRDWCDIKLRLFSYCESGTTWGNSIVAARTIIHRADISYNPMPRVKSVVARARRGLKTLRAASNQRSG